MDESALKIYSLGIVVEAKPVGTDYILVVPIEQMNALPGGDIKKQQKSFKGSKPSAATQGFNTEHQAKSYVRAKWLPLSESNRISAPDVGVNETVLLYKFSNVEEYYWSDIMREPSLRRLEDVWYSYSNLKDGQKLYDKDSTYYVRVNTRDKFIHLHTSINEKEHCGYDITINTKDGTLEILDTKKNYIKLDSSKDSVTIKVNKDINLEAGNDINLKAANKITTKSGSTTSIDASKDTTITGSSGVSVSSSSSIVTDAPATTLKAAGISLNTASVHNTGSLHSDGTATASPNVPW